MKMITVQVTMLVDDDISGDDAVKKVDDAIDHIDEYDDQASIGYEWHEVALEAERPYAEES